MTQPALAHDPPLTEDARTLWDLLSSGASKNEDAIAVHSVHQNVQLTFRQLLDSSEQIARSWSEARVTGPVLVLVGNCVEFVQLLWATARLGLPFCPVNPKSNEELLQHYTNSVKPEVIVVQNSSISNTLKGIESSLQTVKLRIVVDVDDHIPDGWKTLEPLTHDGAQLAGVLPQPRVTVDDVALIIFTSGTTNLPKGALHTGITLSSLIYTTVRWRSLNPSRTMLCHIPTFHVFAVAGILCYLSSGAAIVFPSPSFDAATTLSAIELGLCTDLSLVPSMYRMLVEHPNFDRTKVKGVKTVGLGGSMIPPDFVQAVSEAFSASAFSGFGMSEGMGMLSWHLETEDEVHTPEYVSVGKAGYGVSVKICDPQDEFGKPLSHGEDGMLHVAGDLMIRSYLGGVSPESFYKDESGRQWFRTGDQARMDADGAVYILGRFKDIIIRGGENIAPAAIEVILNQFEGVESQVIGIPDNALVGEEMPCAVIRQRPGTQPPPMSKLQAALGQAFGPSHCLGRLVSLDDLGLKAFPSTATGKVRKDILRKTLMDFDALSMKHKESAVEPMSGVAEAVLAIWSELLSTPIGELEQYIPIDQLADSLTLTRVRGLLHKRVGRDIPESVLRCPGGIAEQITLIERYHPAHDRTATTVTRAQGPPQLGAVLPARGSVEKLQIIQNAAEELGSRFNLGWADVEEVYSSREQALLSLHQRRIHHSNIRVGLWAQQTSMDKLQTAFRQLLRRWGSLRVLFANPGGVDPCFVQFKPAEEWSNQVFTTHPEEIADEEALRNLARSVAEPVTPPPGPLFKVLFVPVKSSTTTPNGIQTSAAIMVMNHSIFDLFSIKNLYEDLHALIDNPAFIPSRVPLSHFANMLYDSRHSASAEISIAYWAHHWSSISTLPSPIWPPQRSPGWYLGNDDGAPEQPHRTHLDPRGWIDGVEGAVSSHTYPIGTLSRLRITHGIHPIILIKSAFAFFLTLKTNTTTAIFTSIQAGRSWPFAPDWLRDKLPSAMDIAGPTYAGVIDVLPAPRFATVLEFLQAIADAQADAVTHMHAPGSLVRARLSPADAAALVPASGPNKFNWLAPLSSATVRAAEKLKAVCADRHFSVGLLWNFQQIDGEPDVVRCMVNYDDCQISREEVLEALEEVWGVAEWMVEEGNWGRVLGECGEEISRR